VYLDFARNASQTHYFSEWEPLRTTGHSGKRPMRNLAGSVAIVTGGGRGIGKAIALELAGHGAAVAVAGPNPETLLATADEVVRQGGRALAVPVDVRRDALVQSMARQVRDALGPVDILVNNAAIIGPTAPVEEIAEADWDEVLAVNLTGAFLCCRAILPGMFELRRGKIVNIASMAGKMAYALRSPYAVSKWGLIGLTLTLAQEAGANGVQVNAICPGPVEGPRMDRVIANRAQELGQDPAAVKDEYVARAALKRMVRAEDVSRLVAFLVSVEGDNITGQAIDVSAGYAL
jgi:NAD(P)-dependent dehydrogenase (short-subunit alcohol dehydrogenase family)